MYSSHRRQKYNQLEIRARHNRLPREETPRDLRAILRKKSISNSKSVVLIPNCFAFSTSMSDISGKAVFERISKTNRFSPYFCLDERMVLCVGCQSGNYENSRNDILFTGKRRRIWTVCQKNRIWAGLRQLSVPIHSHWPSELSVTDCYHKCFKALLSLWWASETPASSSGFQLKLRLFSCTWYLW